MALGYFVRRDTYHHQNLVFLSGFERITVEEQEGSHRKQSRALVAIDEWMVLRDAEPECGSESEQRGAGFIDLAVARPVHGTFQKTCIANPCETTESI